MEGRAGLHFSFAGPSKWRSDEVVTMQDVAHDEIEGMFEIVERGTKREIAKVTEKIDDPDWWVNRLLRGEYRDRGGYLI